MRVCQRCFANAVSYCPAANWNEILIILGFLPIVIIEALVIKRILKADSLLTSFFASLVANLISAIAGFILLMGIDFIGNLIIPKNSIYFYIDFIYPYIIILIIAFYVSVGIENLIVERFFKNKDKKLVGASVWKANTVTYSLMFVFILLVYILEYFRS